ncbi:hypothetical protein Goshw_023616 [Gossypium schwendimanii]|uniref:NAF domain-containing protein n=1 Tax=Gossypium schwendimanii TaxID=34291 RepID=A0A7J9LBM8_GOSSC|nr:hypothetical protein [Gossypium schwendimanii]
MTDTAKTKNPSFLPGFTFSSWFSPLISATATVFTIVIWSRRIFLDKEGNLKVINFGFSVFMEHLKQDGLLRRSQDGYLFRKSIPKTKTTKEEIEFEALNGEKSSKPEILNAFHIILLSKDIDLSLLLKEKKREEKEELRFATTRPTSSKKMCI